MLAFFSPFDLLMTPDGVGPVLMLVVRFLHAITAAFHEVREHRRRRSTATAGEYEGSIGTYEESKRSLDPYGRHR